LDTGAPERARVEAVLVDGDGYRVEWLIEPDAPVTIKVT